jgi:hypothetical protein
MVLILSLYIKVACEQALFEQAQWTFPLITKILI